MDVVKIGVLGLAGVMLALQFKSVKPEISIYMGLAVGIVIFCFSVDGLLGILDKIQSLQSYIKSGEGYFGLLFKAVGVTYICEFTAAVCKDAGYGAVACASCHNRKHQCLCRLGEAWNERNKKQKQTVSDGLVASGFALDFFGTKRICGESIL